VASRGSQAIKYDRESRPIQVKSGDLVVCRFAYDGDGVRRKRVDANGTIHYVGAYERNVGDGAVNDEVITKHYYADLDKRHRLVAFRKGARSTASPPTTGAAQRRCSSLAS
jgi:YD repeat-containing protein